GGGGQNGSFAIDLNGDLIIGSGHQVYRINHLTGASTFVSQNGLLLGGNVWSVAVEPSGNILAVAGTNSGFHKANLGRIDPATGAQTLVSSNGNFSTPRDVAVGDNGVIYVIDGNHTLIKVDPVTGQQTVLNLSFFPQWGNGLAALVTGAGGMAPLITS